MVVQTIPTVVEKIRALPYRAVGVYVLVKMILPETELKTDSGFIVATDLLGNRTGMEVNPKRGIVLDIGELVKLRIKKGDTILFNPYEGFGISELSSETHFGWVKDVGIIGYLTSKA